MFFSELSYKNAKFGNFSFVLTEKNQINTIKELEIGELDQNKQPE
jgi:hypothetical protein